MSGALFITIMIHRARTLGLHFIRNMGRTGVFMSEYMMNDWSIDTEQGVLKIVKLVPSAGRENKGSSHKHTVIIFAV